MTAEHASTRLRILAFEPYYGGSHRAFLDTWVAHSRHAWTLETLPARHWKWRMRGSALWLAERRAGDPAGGFDALLTSDMTSVADLRALLPKTLAALPVVCYFHENQLTYPLSPTDWRDYQYGMTNISSALAADAAWFNSHAHRDAFLGAADRLLRQMSDFVPRKAIRRIEERSAIHYPAVEPPPEGLHTGCNHTGGPLRILWSHRWEYDKGPEAFFSTLLRLHDAGAEFDLVLVGEQFRTLPDAFRGGLQRLSGHVVHQGYLDSRAAYWQMIASCDVVVSTAIQENFGLAVVEAMLAGCRPLLPDRLSYPELVAGLGGESYLYRDEAELYERLLGMCRAPREVRGPSLDGLRQTLADRFLAPQQAQRLDDAFSRCVFDAKPAL